MERIVRDLLFCNEWGGMNEAGGGSNHTMHSCSNEDYRPPHSYWAGDGSCTHLTHSNSHMTMAVRVSHPYSPVAEGIGLGRGGRGVVFTACMVSAWSFAGGFFLL